MPGKDHRPFGNLIAAFERMNFCFERVGGTPTIRGYAEDGVLEIITGSNAAVALLTTVACDPSSLTRTAARVATLVSCLDVDFTPWLSDLLVGNGSTEPWQASKSFGLVTIDAECFGADAVLLTVRAEPSLVGVGASRRASTAQHRLM